MGQVPCHRGWSVSPCSHPPCGGPLAHAHSPAGTPKSYCESQSDRSEHDYAPVSSGFLLYGNEDGNVGGDCDPGFSVTPGTPCAGFDDPANPLTFYVGLCDADLNPPVADWDEHNEFAFGGAWLLSENGAGVASTDPSVGAGTEYCFGAAAHHANPVTVTVNDVVLGAGAALTVAADTVDLTGTGAGCGDFESDRSTPGTGTVTATFNAGLDGSYQVYVELGSMGHLTTN